MLFLTTLAAGALLLGLARRRSDAIRHRVERRLVAGPASDDLRPLACSN